MSNIQDAKCAVQHCYECKITYLSTVVYGAYCPCCGSEVGADMSDWFGINTWVDEPAELFAVCGECDAENMVSAREWLHGAWLCECAGCGKVGTVDYDYMYKHGDTSAAVLGGLRRLFPWSGRPSV